MKTNSDWNDRVGAVTSSLCALHCALCALAPAIFAALGLGFLLSHEAELGLSVVAILFGAGAMAFAWRQHRTTHVVALLGLGIVCLVASRGLEMGVDHHDHHGEAHHQDDAHHDDDRDDHDNEAKAHRGELEQASKAGHDDEGHEGEGHEEEGHEEHGDMMHAAGALVGVLGGLLLAFGHLFNIRSTRRWREDCCD